MATPSTEGLGGNASAHAQKETEQTSDVNKIDGFIRKGQEILDTFVSSIRSFEGQALKIQSLAKSVKEIQTDLKRKSNEDSSMNQSNKRIRNDTISSNDSDSEAADDDSEVEEIMSGTSHRQEQSADTLFTDMDQFFEEEGTITDAIKEPVAEMINKNMRRTKIDAQRLEKLVTSYKRPENVNSLQVPKVDRFLWNQLKHHVKTADVARQGNIDSLNKAAGPLVTAMDHCYNNECPDTALLKRCIGDCFKLICASVNKINIERREAIKKELDPRFRSLCSSDKPVSATGLFGDNLQEQSKQLDASKQIKMTNSQPSIKDAFFRAGKGSNQRFPQATPHHRTTQSRPSYRPPSKGLEQVDETALEEKLQRQIGVFRNEIRKEKQRLTVTEKVDTVSTLTTNTLNYRLVNTPNNFRAGKISQAFNSWRKITQDRWILQTICGYTVELDNCSAPSLNK